MRPQGRGSRLAAALVLAMALGGVTAQVAIADDDTDVPTRKQVREAKQAVDDQTLDVDGIQQALDAANDRLEVASIAAAQAAEEFNGARWEAKLARGDARRAAAVAQDAADDAERQRAAYQDSLVTSYTHGSSLGALTSVVESDGLSELVQRSATMRNSESAMDARYDDFLAAQSEAEDAAQDAEDALDEAEDAEESARDARDAAQVAADNAAVLAQDIAAEKTDLIARLAELKGISVELADAPAVRARGARRGGGRRTGGRGRPARGRAGAAGRPRPDDADRAGAAGTPGRPRADLAASVTERRRPGRDRVRPGPARRAVPVGCRRAGLLGLLRPDHGCLVRRWEVAAALLGRAVPAVDPDRRGPAAAGRPGVLGLLEQLVVDLPRGPLRRRRADHPRAPHRTAGVGGVHVLLDHPELLRPPVV